MEILLISDTHGNQKMIKRMVDYAYRVDLVIHLGDDYKDALPFIEINKPTIRIPGTWGQEYQDPMIENRRLENFHKWRFYLTHTPTKDSHDLPSDEDPMAVIFTRQCDVFCHGHTHQPEIKKIGDVVVLNPGHLKYSSDRGFPASFAHLFIDDDSCRIQLIEERSRSLIDELTLK